MKSIYVKLLLVVVLSSTLTGCFGVTGEFRALRNDILNHIDGNFTRDVEFGIGSVGISLASSFVALSDADDYVDDLLRQVSRVQIAVYENRNRRDNFKINSVLLKEISDKMTDSGWDYIVRSVERNEMTIVFVKSENVESIENLFIIALNDDELVMAELYGDLNEAIGIAIRENGLNLHMAKN